MKRNKISKPINIQAMKNKEFSILKTLEDIHEVLNAHNGESCVYDSVPALDPLVNELAAQMKISKSSALHFACVFCLTVDEDSVQMREITNKLKVSISKIRVFKKGIESLVESGLVFKEQHYQGRTEYGIPAEIRHKVFEDIVPLPESLTTDIYGFHGYVNKYLGMLDETYNRYDHLVHLVNTLIKANSTLPVCEWILSNNITGKDMILALGVFNRAMNGYMHCNLKELCEASARTHKERFVLRSDMHKGNHPLFNKGIIEWEGDDVQSKDFITITQYGIEVFLGPEASLILNEDASSKNNGLIVPDKINFKKLYYNQQEKENVNRIAELIGPGRYDEVCERYKSQGMTPGLCILFYGGPGTGKTESVLQLAKQTGRPICQVDISAIKDKWVGESEKRAKAIFTEYRKLCKSGSITPILLLNEADAIINKRIEVSRSVDQMSNAIQNIFLEEMEKFEGILIATTNLQNNFDDAFDRRFLFKVRFDKPSAEVRAQIINERIPSLSSDEAIQIASKYEMSGGQVENVARKSVTEFVISGVTANRELIERFCMEEICFRNNGAGGNRIGFSPKNG
jgi:hypothetical protein